MQSYNIIQTYVTLKKKDYLIARILSRGLFVFSFTYLFICLFIYLLIYLLPPRQHIPSRSDRAREEEPVQTNVTNKRRILICPYAVYFLFVCLF